MKFGKYIIQNSVDEWKKQYLNYAMLKRMIKRITIESNIVTEENMNQRFTKYPSYRERNNVEISSKQKEEFFDFLKKELEKVNLFYSQIIQEIYDTFNSMKEMMYQKEIYFSEYDQINPEFIECEKEILYLYHILNDLYKYRNLNYEGFRKIVKKWDKKLHDNKLSQFITRLNTQKFVTDKKIDSLIIQFQNLYTELSHGKLFLNDEYEKKISKEKKIEMVSEIFKPYYFGLAILLAVIIYFIPLFNEYHTPPQKCLSLLIFVFVMWLTESVPYHITAIIIPFLVVFLKILREPISHISISQVTAVKMAFSSIFDHTTALIIGCFSLSLAFKKYQFHYFIAIILQKKFGHKPYLFLFGILKIHYLLIYHLGFMAFCCFSSLLISNLASVLLGIAVITPMIRDFPLSLNYVHTIILSIAFSCNIGGILSPISSPQNMVALSYTENTHLQISFLTWIIIAFPIGLLMLTTCWVYFLIVMKPFDILFIPPILVRPQKNKVQIFVIAVFIFTISLWCSFKWTASFFGDSGIIALIPFILFFGTGILTKKDFLDLKWELILFVGGANVLSMTIKNSGLLTILSLYIYDVLKNQSHWLIMLLLLIFTLFSASMISHTISALLILPLIIELISHRAIFLIVTMMISCSMILPFTSFPNLNCLLLTDDYEKEYLGVWDFFKHGFVISLFCYIILSSSYSLLYFIL